MAAMSGKVLQNVSVAHHCQQNRKFHTQQSRDFLASKMHSFLPLSGRRWAWNDILAMRLRTLPISQSGFVNRRTVYCNAASSETAVPSLEKNDFLKLQNGRREGGLEAVGTNFQVMALRLDKFSALQMCFRLFASRCIVGLEEE